MIISFVSVVLSFCFFVMGMKVFGGMLMLVKVCYCVKVFMFIIC